MSAIPGTDQTTPRATVTDARAGHRKLVAALPIKEGETILEACGVVHDHPTRHTLQIEAAGHLGPPSEEAVRTQPQTYAWIFTNHHCDPNTFFRGRTLVARRAITVGEELSFDYNSTEWDMSEPFECWCDAIEGRHHVRGFKHLSPERRAVVAPYAARWLLER